MYYYLLHLLLPNFYIVLHKVIQMLYLLGIKRKRRTLKFPLNVPQMHISSHNLWRIMEKHLVSEITGISSGLTSVGDWMGTLRKAFECLLSLNRQSYWPSTCLTAIFFFFFTNAPEWDVLWRRKTLECSFGVTSDNLKCWSEHKTPVESSSMEGTGQCETLLLFPQVHYSADTLCKILI